MEAASIADRSPERVDEMSRPFHVPYAALMSCVPVATSAQAPVQPQPTAVEGAIAHVYKSAGGAELRLHVFNPTDHRPTVRRAAIVFFFGGGWVSGSVEQFAPQSRHLAQRGMIAIVTDYKVFKRHRTSALESMADAKSAIRWVRAHAAELGIDPNRIAAGGGSADGHIALSAAVCDGFDETTENRNVSSKPNALVLFNPVVHTADESRRGRFGGRGREASPIHHIRSGLPPTVIFHGKSDTTVPFATVERFCAGARERGNECRLIGYEGATHGFFNPKTGRRTWYRETLLQADRFLTRTAFLPGPVPTRLP